MDGLKGVVPLTCHDEPIDPPKPKNVQMDLFGEPEQAKPMKELPLTKPCPGCKLKKPLDGIFLHNGQYCNIMDWSERKPFRYVDLIRMNEEDRKRKENAKGAKE